MHIEMNEACIAITRWFEDRAAAFLHEHHREMNIVKPRVDHIRKVASLCRSLAGQLCWSRDDINIMEIIGILHDIGRFSQYEDYHTFIDAYSVDHTKRGYEDVKRIGILDSLSDHYQTIISEGIRYHNTRNFRKYVHKESVPYIRLIRDADKLEKYLSIDSAFEEGTIPEHSLSMDDRGPVNMSAVEFILRNHKIPKKHIHSQLDYHLLQLSWIFEVSYPITFRRIADSGAINRIISLLPDDSYIKKATNHIRTYLALQLKEKINKPRERRFGLR